WRRSASGVAVPGLTLGCRSLRLHNRLATGWEEALGRADGVATGAGAGALYSRVCRERGGPRDAPSAGRARPREAGHTPWTKKEAPKGNARAGGGSRVSGAAAGPA